jgi:hypothetical protein
MFEDRQTKETFDKYFPADQNLQAPSHQPHAACPVQTSQPHCIHTSPPCSFSCHHHSHRHSHPPCQQPQQCSDPDLSSTVNNLVLDVAEIAKDTKLLKILMKNINQNDNLPPNDAIDDGVSPDNIQSALDSEPEDTELPPNPPAASASRQDANESFASIEEFITDAELGFEDPLNFQLPTTQP